jgi:pimeloyl-ACP methyl ester carboxylesterase
MTRIEIGGLQTWYDEVGSGEPLVLLHGGLATNQAWSPQIPELASRFRVSSPDGPDHWAAVLEKFVELVSREPRIARTELTQIACPTLVLAGDDDVVSLEHTIELFRAILDAELAIVPGTSTF